MTSIPNFDLYQVKVYSDSKQSYFTFTTPEASKAINTYLSYRERYGEKLTATEEGQRTNKETRWSWNHERETWTRD